jgi:hypothetical protein
MSQINVNLVAPYDFGTVSINGAQIHANLTNQSFKITNNTNQILGLSNVVIGMGAGNNLTSSSNGNTIVGKSSGNQMTDGINNTLVGVVTGSNITTGYGNTLIGKQSGVLTTTGYYNTGIGDSAGDQTTTGNNNVALGAFSNQASGTTSNSITLGNVSHNVLRCAVTSITSLSDARDKKDVSPLELGLDFVKELKPVTFVWDDRDENGKHDISDSGFIAQDLKELEEKYEAADVLKLVYDENPERLEATYGRLIPVLVQAIKDLAAEVETLKNK